MEKSWLKDGDITLRAPEPEDLELMYAMENDTSMWCAGNATLPYSRYTLRAYLEQSRQDLLSERQARFVIETESGPAGMIDLADYDPLNSRAEVCIGILGCYRGKGIASALFEYVKANYSAKVKRFRLEVTKSNARAVRLYTKLGFQELQYLQMHIDN